jgi:hypothetical protein
MVIEVSSRAIRFNPTVGVIKLFWIRSQDSVLEYNIMLEPLKKEMYHGQCFFFSSLLVDTLYFVMWLTSAVSLNHMDWIT